jgi:hypothetical protein
LTGGYRDLRGRCTTDCLVTTITVTLCDRRDSTDVRYPPICAFNRTAVSIGRGLHIGSLCS